MATQREPEPDTSKLLTSDGSASSPSKSLKRKKPAPDASTTSNVSNKRKRRKGNAPDAEYGVSRGVDFVDVSCVINFDLPTTSRAYTHRVGRTARAGRTGMALSFVVPASQWGKNKVVGCVPSAAHDEEVFARIEREQGARGSTLKEYTFDMKQVDAFRYRMEDALRAVTRSAIKEARIKDLKAEILNSDKLKVHFEDNPLDLEYLRHDKPLHPTRVQSHMKHIPKYLLPRIAPVPGSVGAEGAAEGGGIPSSDGDVGFVSFNKHGARGRGRGRGRGKGRGGRGGGGRGGRKKSDPLKNFG